MNVDVCPTVLDFAGVDIPDSVQGRSLRPLMAAPTPPTNWRRSAYYAYYEDSWRLRDRPAEEMAEPGFQYFTPHRVGPHRGVRTERYKLIQYFSEGDYWELFDLETDPDELDNRYADPACAGVVTELQAELTRLRQQYGDTG